MKQDTNLTVFSPRFIQIYRNQIFSKGEIKMGFVGGYGPGYGPGYFPGYGGYGAGLIIVLFILVIIIGAAWWWYGGYK